MSYDAFDYRFKVKRNNSNNLSSLEKRQKAQTSHIDATIDRMKADFDLEDSDTIATLRERAHETVKAD